MNELQVFTSREFGTLDVLMMGNKAYFPASECATLLGYAKPQDAIARHCRYSVKHGVPHPQSSDKTMEKLFIPEGDLYRLIARSKLPGAFRFESWVFDEVLPSIRAHGAYLTPLKLEAMINNPKAWIRLLNALQEEREAKEALQLQVVADKPKIVFADAVSISESTILIGELAKILKGNGIEIGQNRLFKKLRQDGYLIKRKGTDYNTPTQRAMELGLFKVKETAITHSDGHVTISKTTKVTGKGQQYFINLFLGEEQKLKGKQ